MVGPLSNSRHEAFAQNLAKGMSQTQAYIEAGYSENGAEVSASRLLTNAKVEHRLNELKAEAAKGTVLTIERATNDLLRIARKGELLQEAPGLSVARAAIMDACKLNGLVVDVTKNDHTTNGKPIGDNLSSLMAGLVPEFAARGKAEKAEKPN